MLKAAAFVDEAERPSSSSVHRLVAQTACGAAASLVRVAATRNAFRSSLRDFIVVEDVVCSKQNTGRQAEAADRNRAVECCVEMHISRETEKQPVN